jgi:hypothetical protein
MRDPLEGVSAVGTIVTGARRDHVAPHFEPVLAAACDQIQTHTTHGSLYVYGSVATGQARVGSSDVDLLAIDVRRDVAEPIGQILSQRFSTLCRAVEIGTANPSDYLGDSDQAYGNRVFLHHYCVHFNGPQHLDGLRDYPADTRAARGFNGDFAYHARRWRLALDSGDDDTALARRVARKSLLAVAGLVSIHDNTWTTDRATAAHRWAQVEPELADDLKELLSWSDGQVAPRHAEMVRLLYGLILHLITVFESTIGLWP